MASSVSSYNVYLTRGEQQRRLKCRGTTLRSSLAAVASAVLVLALAGIILPPALQRSAAGVEAAPGLAGGPTRSIVEMPASGPSPATVRALPVTSVAEAVVSRSALPINTSYAGVSMFRGNGHRTYYGEGPVPRDPVELWHHPQEGIMSADSSEGGVTTVWSGTGWTGQPVVVEWEGSTRVMFGAYDRALHFLDATSGERFLPDLATGDIIKGSVMFDPDGYPLLYSGSRDNYFRIVALDRGEPTVVYKLSAYDVPQPTWNDDWDSSALVVGDYLFQGGENGYFYILKLNRGYDGAGLVTVDPEVVLAYPAFDQALFSAIGDNIVSIENSPAIHLDGDRGDRVYFANGGGRVLGLDISALGLSQAGYGPAGQAPGTWEAAAGLGAVGSHGVASADAPDAPGDPAGLDFPLAFKFWMGDDVDATLVLDEEGMLYVAAELERHLPRAREVGQLVKLDPYAPDDPLLWSVAVPATGGDGGIWATPALSGGMLYVPTHTGRLLGVDCSDGRIVWEKPFSYHAWSSPVVVDHTLLVADAEGYLHAYDVRDPGTNPPQLWKVAVGQATIESTPVVWRGRIFLGSRDGHFYCFGDEG